MAERISKNTYHVDVYGDNGVWWDFVIAENEEEAKQKVIEVYKDYHKNMRVEIKSNYDYYII